MKSEGGFKAQNIMVGKRPIIVAGVVACYDDTGCVIRISSSYYRSQRDPSSVHSSPCCLLVGR